MDISFSNLIGVPLEALIKSINLLEELVMIEVQITSQQFQTICSDISSISYNHYYSLENEILFYSISQKFYKRKPVINL